MKQFSNVDSEINHQGQLTYAGRIDVGGGMPDLEGAGYLKDGELVQEAIVSDVGGFFIAKKPKKCARSNQVQAARTASPQRPTQVIAAPQQGASSP
jgi:hypothetical protein